MATTGSTPKPFTNGTPGTEQRARTIKTISFAGFVSRYAVLAAFVAVVIFFCIARPHTFATWGNVTSILGEAAPSLILAVGLTFVLVLGDFDLSFASVVGLGAAAFAIPATHGWPVALAIVLAFAICASIGIINGLVISIIGASSFIVTLAVGVAATGIEYAFSNQNTIYGGIPPVVAHFAGGSTIGSISNLVWVAAVIAVLAALLLDRTEVGRYAYATGGNSEAARLSGVRTRRLRIGGFIVVAAAAGLVGMLLVGQASSYTPNAGAPYLLPVYAAAYLGTACFRPGQFNIPGTVIGVLFLGVIQTGLTMFSLATYAIDLVEGAILLAAVILSRISREEAA